MEIEMKFECENKDLIKKYAEKEGFTLKKKTHEKDTYFIVGEMKNRKKTYLRLRQDLLNNVSSIDYHEVISDTAAKETELSVQDVDTALRLLDKLSDGVKCVVDKKREKYWNGYATITIDEVKGLGAFVEIEIESEDLNESEMKIRKIQGKLGLQDSKKIVKKGYPDMIMETKKN